MTHELAFRMLVRALVARNIFPSPTVLSMELGRGKRNTINGAETAWRTDELQKLGYRAPLTSGWHHWSHTDEEFPTPSSNRKMQRDGEDLVCMTEGGIGEVYHAVLEHE